jgi:hypothetical protein
MYGKCDRCREMRGLQKYSYGIFFWYFCKDCYINQTTKVSSYFGGGKR